ncbi:MAG: hypothetical protein ACKO5K_03960, partial [Armatimonadota bacterium]
MILASPASAQNPTEQYLVQRRAAGWNPSVRFETVARDPAAHRDRVFEIEGRLTGVARNEDDSALLILSETPSGSLPLTMTVLPTWLQPGARVRVLCALVPPEDGETVLGMPGIAVIAVASAVDIAAAEAKAARAIASARPAPATKRIAVVGRRAVGNPASSVRGG